MWPKIILLPLEVQKKSYSKQKEETKCLIVRLRNFINPEDNHLTNFFKAVPELASAEGLRNFKNRLRMSRSTSEYPSTPQTTLRFLYQELTTRFRDVKDLTHPSSL
ncbi:Uncharacterized protein Fot_20619 [Forsythia ovata]|uniref:Uncharacterized protein n=1 Tax=Forsythia ovata TaxID=205694 RepID=A0ABD1UUB5_9LAMI